MIVTYEPENGERREWDYKPDQVRSDEAERAEDATGLTWDEINVGLLKGSMKSRRAALWLLMRQDNPQLRYKDVSFRSGEVTVEWDKAEKVAVREGILASNAISDEDKEQALALLGDDEGDEAAADPKEATA